ncbi:hypothetical protein [Flavobacterium sp. UBA4854]|uniref:hypothetical protein n=1 Tax=Flavobacterium sp. UBA4854 TaxID=1946548 RepID=UPI00257CBB7F|nr:hypothetical protein [Flavobacterium sp. UBA4854]
MGWIGAIISLFIALILRAIARDEENKLINEGKKARTRLRKIGKRIPVSYNELEIKTNCWVQEVEVGTGRNSHNEYIDVNLNVIIFKITFDNIHFREEYRIDMEPQILKMKLAMQKELSFYYDPNNVKDNFLDFEFLFDN